jgi:hypothetical protein
VDVNLDDSKVGVHVGTTGCLTNRRPPRGRLAIQVLKTAASSYRAMLVSALGDISLIVTIEDPKTVALTWTKT